MATAKKLIASLLKLKNSRYAKQSAPFLGVKPGLYGENDKLLGVTVPVIRKSVIPFYGLALLELEHLFISEYHEIRAAGVYILVQQFKKCKNLKEQKIIYDFYIQQVSKGHVNNWDLVDSSAHLISGRYLFEKYRDHGVKILLDFASSSSIWTRRVGVLSSFYHIKQNDFEATLTLAKNLLSDEHHLIHKAVGWMLREVGKREEKVLLTFLDEYSSAMPRIMLQYSMEKLTKTQKRSYLKKSNN